MLNEKRCVLIVDDDIKILRSLSNFLKSNNFHVLEATDVKMALEDFYENCTIIDLILLDVMMPAMDGFAVLKEIRQSSLVPVIMLTARGEENHSGLGLYIVKTIIAAHGGEYGVNNGALTGLAELSEDEYNGLVTELKNLKSKLQEHMGEKHLKTREKIQSKIVAHGSFDRDLSGIRKSIQEQRDRLRAGASRTGEKGQYELLRMVV